VSTNQDNLHSPELTKGRSGKSAQSFLDIQSIHDDTIVMRNGSMRTVLMVSSVNFALKSEDEQNAIIFGYQNFINSLDFPVQIVINSRKLDITDYLEDLAQKEQTQTNELLRIQTMEYRQYIQELISLADIMRKRFYVAVPYFLAENKENNFLTTFRNLFKPVAAIEKNRTEFKKHKNQLDQRTERVTAGLSSMGLKSARLKTQELIELYYNYYNPEVTPGGELADVKELGVSSGE